MGKDFPRLSVFLSTVFCANCSGQTAIKDYSIYLDDTHDIIFDGKCVTCNHDVSRYIETGEGKSTAEAAKHIRVVKLAFSTR